MDALVVLGCRVLADGRAGTALQRRVNRAAELYRAGAAPRVLMSGGRRWGTTAEADAMLRHWLELGLDDGAVLLERRSLTTRGNARCSADLLLPEGLTRIGLVTCDYHLPRATRLFAAEGLLVRGYAATVARPLPRRVWLWTRELGARVLSATARGSAHWTDDPASAPPRSTR